MADRLDFKVSHPVATPAATIIVMREVAGGPPELLIVERSKALAFAGGALVFPGGRVDPGDRDLAGSLGAADLDDAAARIAAIRETIEEAGLPIGLDPPPDVSALARIRTGLHDGTTLSDLLHELAIGLSLASLTAFARWKPVYKLDRVFDTRFYLARLPLGSPEASVDAIETVGLRWASAAAVLAENDAGRATLIFPTRRMLERLARFGSYAEAVTDASAYPMETISPWVEERDGERWICIPEGVGYPITHERLAAATRG